MLETFAGFILLGIGAVGIVWFLKNLLSPRFNKAMAFQQYKGILFLIILVFIIAGLVLIVSGGKIDL